MVAGDFNALLDIDDKEGGLRKPTKVMEDFRDFVANCRLFDIILKNRNFTWTNRRLNFSKISERLDWLFVGEGWLKGDQSLESSITPQKKIQIEEELDALGDLVMNHSMTNTEFELEKSLKDQYAEILKREETYWKEKSRELWITDGDLNTKFLHAFSKARRIYNRIDSIKDESGSMKRSTKDIEIAALDYFIGILGKAEVICDNSGP
ncbi:uncharacterized protein LOC131858612 [Cryptomeria japonica]|uniref:uncharacterized protein LOC131858612 n=1 Tax=Cryptomeria japonica TaxID=3369 RepID=UPI0027DA8436|nr:uncharacterized protein LOC131858612 [Cryptomeria japonica]